MRSLLDGITSALRIPQEHSQQQQVRQQGDGDYERGSSSNTVTGNTMSVVPSLLQETSHMDSSSHSVSDVLPNSGIYRSCRFSTESFPNLPFTMLLLTQNIGGIETHSFMKNKVNEEVFGDSELEKDGKGVSNVVRQLVTEFIAELRLLIHEACRREYVTYLRKSKTSLEGRVSSSIENDFTREGSVPPLLDVIVVHFQEIGGKQMNTEFNTFFAEALNALLPEAGWASGLLMEANDDAQRFTALGSIVFLSHRMCPISSILSFRHRTFVSVTDDPATYASSPTFLFHGNRFSGAGRSRKGYLLTSLRFGTVVVNFLNVHLYNDPKNKTAAEASPSMYALQRQEALLEAMTESVVFISPQDPLFIFGDFNTRLDTFALLQHLKEFRQIDVELDVKDVRAPDTFWELFRESSHMEMIKKFDVEMERLMDVVAQQSGVELAEFVVRFPPTYSRLPVENPSSRIHSTSQVTATSNREEKDMVSDEENERKKQRIEAETLMLSARIAGIPERGYLRQRIPAWCDRVVWNPAGLELMTGVRSSSSSLPPPSLFENNNNSEESMYRYTYRSFALAHTDHDAVGLFF
ncbi:hypothetical protein LSM04_001226 [Trypanosoma melophagium]|uniref:uncharacterized protein n=1 Tax=Trypanosoma melophagium TaxID=715481 RepID=UPI00351A4079|nr:hypothetical protein LSM04_001226 [Trypanosoma melophagium]